MHFAEKCFNYYREKIGDYGPDNVPFKGMDCDCPDACEELNYKKTVSFANWPVNQV